MLRLEPMDDPQFAVFLERAIPRRAERYVRRGVWAEEEALAASRALYARALPNGRRTEGQNFCRLVQAPGGTPVGEVWYSVQPEGGRVLFWVEWIWIEPEHRRRGLATEAFRELVAEAKRQGASRVGLDVWFDNPGAIELYRKLGFAPARMSMILSVGPEASVAPGSPTP